MNVLTETVSQLGGKMSDAKKTVEDLARSAGDQIDQARHDTADALHTAASSVRTTGGRSANAIGQGAADAADKLDATASFVQEHDLGTAITSLRRFGRRHPTSTFLAGVAIGMFAGSVATGIALARAK
jgi:ABC-type transporter Mla subunit MlaD